MKRPFIVLLLSLMLLAFSERQQAISAKSSISFTFESEDVTGSIGDLKSTSKIDTVNFEQSILQGSVAVNTLKTGNFLRDGHLMWKKYFSEKKHPRISFTSTKITKLNKDTYEITGTLTIKGISKEEQLNTVVKDNNILATATINSADYDITIDKEKANNKVNITLNFLLD